jgi:integrase/recombinase XerD
LRAILARRAKQAGVPTPSPHMFRRAFALGMLRDGADLISLQRLLGHSSMDMVACYVKQADADLQKVHATHSPADKLLGR